MLFGGWGRNRTGVHGFAGRCMATLPPSLKLKFNDHYGAGNETRTRDPNLGKVVLYQLSYSRTYIILSLHNNMSRFIYRRGRDLNPRKNKFYLQWFSRPPH